jgi:uncharacterized repeat protein (TIGR01451 family)
MMRSGQYPSIGVCGLAAIWFAIAANVAWGQTPGTARSTDILRGMQTAACATDRGLPKQQKPVSVIRVTHMEPVPVVGEFMPAEPKPCDDDVCGPRPLPVQNCTGYRPPGIACPWPHDEYICDGDDKMPDVRIDPCYQAHGLDLEDTVAHFDDISGVTHVQPSNRVCIYAPRFASVRRVNGLEEKKLHEQLVGEQQAQLVMGQKTRDQLGIDSQPAKALDDISRRKVRTEKQRQFAPLLERQQYLVAVEDGFLPFEDISAIRTGRLDASDKARLKVALQNAAAWTDKQAVQVILDRVEAIVLSGDQRVQTTFVVDLPEHPRLRVVKIASTNRAHSGDDIDFTIRFDNTGDQTIRNVTILDSLTPRLEYVPDSAKASRDANFCTAANEGDSLTLKWEFTEPLPPGEGGLVRFHCKVR